MKVIIKWEHGDADFSTKESYKFKTENEVKEFLNFLYDLRSGPTQYCQRHTQRENEHVDAINKKYEYKFDGYIQPDHKYSYPIAHIERIYLKDGNKFKHIVWSEALKDNVITLPKIGDEFNTTSGNVCGLGVPQFGGTHKDYLGYHDFEEMGLGAIPNTDGTNANNYAPIKGIIKDIQIDFADRKKYKSEYVKFTYVILVAYKGKQFVISMNGYDKSFEMNEDFLFFY